MLIVLAIIAGVRAHPSRAPQTSRVLRAEPQRPESNGFVRDLNPAGEYDFGDVTQAQAEAIRCCGSRKFGSTAPRRTSAARRASLWRCVPPRSYVRPMPAMPRRHPRYLGIWDVLDRSWSGRRGGARTWGSAETRRSHRAALVSMVQAADFWNGDDPRFAEGLNRP
jgi:hypothetical protein